MPRSVTAINGRILNIQDTRFIAMTFTAKAVLSTRLTYIASVANILDWLYMSHVVWLPLILLILVEWFHSIFFDFINLNIYILI